MLTIDTYRIEGLRWRSEWIIVCSLGLIIAPFNRDDCYPLLSFRPNVPEDDTANKVRRLQDVLSEAHRRIESRHIIVPMRKYRLYEQGSPRSRPISPLSIGEGPSLPLPERWSLNDYNGTDTATHTSIPQDPVPALCGPPEPLRNGIYPMTPGHILFGDDGDEEDEEEQPGNGRMDKTDSINDSPEATYGGEER